MMAMGSRLKTSPTTLKLAGALALAIKNPSGIKFVESKKRGEVSESIIDGTIQNLRKASDFAAKLSLEDHKEAYLLIAQNKVLCGPRNGPLGVSTWNTLLGRAVQGALSDDQFIYLRDQLNGYSLVKLNHPDYRLPEYVSKRK
jgi:hypothetical protein